MTQAGSSMQDALARAQKAGIAETDPRLDVEGYDTAFKLLVAANSIMDGHEIVGNDDFRHTERNSIQYSRGKG